MKKTVPYFLYTMLIAGIVCACNDPLDIVQDYEYRIETLPLPKRIKQGKTVALEFSIIREGYYKEAAYRFRYFQSEGEGILNYRGKAVPMNRFQNIPSDDFVLYYRSECEEQQQLDFVFVESTSGRKVEYSILFASEQTQKKTE